VLGVVLVGAAVLTACRTPGARTDADRLVRIERLAAQVSTPPPVHWSRKPIRDERARLLRELADECEQYSAELGSGNPGAPALTGADGAPNAAARPCTLRLSGALDRLAEAARRGDVQAVKAARSDLLDVRNATGVGDEPASPP